MEVEVHAVLHEVPGGARLVPQDLVSHLGQLGRDVLARGRARLNDAVDIAEGVHAAVVALQVGLALAEPLLPLQHGLGLPYGLVLHISLEDVVRLADVGHDLLDAGVLGQQLHDLIDGVVVLAVLAVHSVRLHRTKRHKKAYRAV